MGTLITGGSYDGDAGESYDGVVIDAGDYDSTEELNDANDEAMTDEWAEEVSNVEHLAEAVESSDSSLSQDEVEALVEASDGSLSGGDSTDDSGEPQPDSGADDGQQSTNQPIIVPPSSGDDDGGMGMGNLLLVGGLALLGVAVVTQR
ncbi:hypothetical protein [Haloarcula sebkhae]|uniref:Uncharacterized protein n=2 Tax=Haloarcula sebkhae TaxID=932660 RepID=A0A830EW84_9EURY|nr:hypothetical protein [Haloarcula sebkhae]GGK63476.1 hypothetical protein GCM10009067_14790 [Haloarcula sebkhae]